VRDTSGAYYFSADNLVYDLDKRILTLQQNAHLKKILSDTIYQQHHKPKSGIKSINRDTLHIYAQKIVYHDSLKWAQATKNVRVVKGDLQINCGSAYYSDVHQTIDFLESPVANFKDNLMQGDTMKLTLKGELFESMAFKSSATGDFYEKEDSVKATEEYHVKGDSIFMKMANNQLHYIEIIEQGVAVYQNRDHPNQLNKMSGRYLKLDFAEDKIDSASIFGRAQSTYFVYDKAEFRGKNEAKGDSIALKFDRGKVNNIYITGRALGTFFGEPEKKSFASDTIR